jgi:alpha-ketoglutaric semialdehyde dehydrogenase
MKLHGKNIIGNQISQKGTSSFSGSNPSNGKALEPSFYEATEEEVNMAFEKADEAFESFQEVARVRRADFLDKIAEEIVALGDDLVHRAMDETGLPEGRIIGERGRTVNQLKLFAGVVRDGSFLEISIDTAQAERAPIPKPDIRMINVALGPVAIFGASNFPLAFSVAGGDTASALAAGCPVVVKAHPAHPGTSELVGMAIKNAILDTGMPEGIFSLLHGNGVETGQYMVKNKYAKAVAFTGSFAGGKALFNLAAAREEPIPCFAEMGSINPVFLLPERLEEQAESIATQYVDSVNLGVGQFCTNPGIVFGIKSNSLNLFIEAASEKISETGGGTMLHKGIKSSYDKSVEAISKEVHIELIAYGNGEGESIGKANLLRTDGASFISNPKLQTELFGPASIIVECEDEEQLQLAARSLHGNLTATLQATPGDLENSKTLISSLERKVGRLLVNGFPTGVEVCHSMVHGGPFPATTDSRFTSVGTSAIKRFLRPICYQDFPVSLLSKELQNDNEQELWRKVDGNISNGSI